MDIVCFLHNGGHISLMAFRSAFTYLNAIQLEKNHVEYDDICQGLLLGADLDHAGIAVHSFLIYEVAMLPYQHSDGSRRMRLQTDSDGEASFIQNVLRALNTFVKGSYFPAVDTFRMDCERYYLLPKNSRITSSSPRAVPYSQRDRRRENLGNINAKCYQALSKSVTFAPASSASNEADAAMIAAQKDNFEICEQGIRFLAEIRRGGMDVLFPQIKHDKILTIIFAVFSIVKTTAHKELIDLIMAVKECGTISNLECVSKTKVRGVIALLKLAMIIETHGGSNEKIPVTLTLSASTDSIETLREQHDEFLGTFGTTQPLLWREEVYWEKLVWGSAFARRLEKLKEIKQFVPLLLACAPMHPVVSAAPPSRVKEIFVTREDALENDSLYHSFSVKFQLTEDEKDNSGVTFTSSQIHPIGPMTPCNLDSDLSSGTSHDEWSSPDSPSLPVHAEYCTPLLTVIPLGGSKTFAFAHSLITLSTQISVPDFSFPARFPPLSRQEQLEKGNNGARLLLRDNAEPLGGNALGHTSRHNSLDSDLFSDISFRSPSPKREEPPEDWHRQFYEVSSYPLHNGNGDDEGGYLNPQVHMTPIGRRNTLPSPPCTPYHANQSPQTQPTQPNQHQQNNQQHNYAGPYTRSLTNTCSPPVPIARHHSAESFHSEHFTQLEEQNQQTQELNYQKLQQHQRLRESRHTLSIVHQLPDGRGGTLAPTFYHPSPIVSPAPPFNPPFFSIPTPYSPFRSGFGFENGSSPVPSAFVPVVGHGKPHSQKRPSEALSSDRHIGRY